MSSKAEDLAYDHWPEILQSCGVGPEFFTGKHGPCPFCGGYDRYIWKKKYGGVYLCNECTEAKYRPGFDFLMRHLSCSFMEAANRVRAHYGIKTDDDARRVIERRASEPVKSTAQDPQVALDRMNRQWSETLAVTLGDPVDLWLKRRIPGLEVIPADIRLHPALPYWDRPDRPNEKPIFRGKFPAMMVRGFDPQGNLVQMHKTYLTTSGHKAPVANVRKTDVGIGANSYSFRLGEVTGNTLGVGEGIETALASSLLRGIPVWPCHSADVMANFQVPESLPTVEFVVIFTDCDAPKNGIGKGEQAARKLAAKLRTDGYRSLLTKPAKVGWDFNNLVV